MQETENHTCPGVATFCCVGINVVLTPTLLKNAEHSSSSLSTCKKGQYNELQHAAKQTEFISKSIKTGYHNVENQPQSVISIRWYLSMNQNFCSQQTQYPLNLSEDNRSLYMPRGRGLVL